MVSATYKIIWTDEAKADLKDIYEFIRKESLQGAKNVVFDIRNAPKSVCFPQQNEKEWYIISIKGLSYEIIRYCIEWMNQPKN